MIARLLLQRALRKGFLGGSRLWTVVGAVGVAMRILKRVTSEKPEVAFSGRLDPGQTIVISHDRHAKVVRPRR